MDEPERRMEQAEGAEAVKTSVETGEAADAVARFGEAGSDSAEEDASGVVRSAGPNSAVEAGSKNQTSVCFDKNPEKQTEVGSGSGAEESERDGAAAEGVESAEEEPVAAEESAGAAGGGSEAEWRRRAEGYALRAVFSEARAAAAMMGVPEDRLDSAARLSDLSGIGPEDEGARERVAQAVRSALKQAPELRGGVGTGQATSPRRLRRDAFERGFLGE